MVPKTKHYQLKVESVNVGFILRINGIQIVSSALQQPKNKAETSIILQQGLIHTVKMELFSTLAGVRSLSFQWHVDSSNEFTNVHGLFLNYKSKYESHTLFPYLYFVLIYTISF